MINKLGFYGSSYQNYSNLLPTNQNSQQQVFLQRVRQANLMGRMLSAGLITPQADKQPDFDQRSFFRDFRTTVGEVRETARSLDVEQFDSVFTERSIEAADPDMVGFQTAEAGAEQRGYELDIQALGEAQVETTDMFDPEAEGEIEAGTYQFQIEQDDILESFEIEVAADDSSREVLEQIAEEIEASELNLGAEVIEESETEIFLELEAREVGTEFAFDVEDIEGNLMLEQLGVEQVQAAEDAEIEIAGLEEDADFTIDGDTVILDSGRVEFDVLETGETELEVRGDIDLIQTEIEEFVSAYESALDFIEEQPTNGDLENVTDRFIRLARFERMKLRNIGIQVDREGRLTIDEGRLERALEEDIEQVETTLGGSMGFAPRVEQIAEDVLSTPPSRYMDLETEEDPFQFDIDIFEFYNQLGQMSYSPLFQQGNLIDIFL